MNTQAKIQRIEAGQALAFPRRAGPVVLTQGEVLLQEPAQWLGGTVIVPRAVRFVAPAVLPVTVAGSVVAVRESTVVVQEAAPVFAGGKVRAVARRLAGTVAAWSGRRWASKLAHPT